MPEPDVILAARGVSVSFGGLKALADVDIDVPSRALIGLVGPNGAGKSTLFSVLSGLRKPDSGEVMLAGRNVTRMSPQARAHHGLARTFQHPELFLGLTVREHLVLAHRVRYERRRLWRDMFTAGCLRRAPSEERTRVDELLAMLSLEPFADRTAAELPLGTSRLVEVGRALAVGPSLVLLDEPFAGLDTLEAERLAGVLRAAVDAEGVSLLLVEHDVAMVLSLSQCIHVLDFGSIIAVGGPEEIRANEAVRAAYLGDVTEN
jgi:branched-chain amino acid transport system ATP-binding protein